jgi:S-DNA-T family DNA segregation ATPase FtsK/SpoIIIE
MTRNELIAKVAVDLIQQQLENESEGTLRFCMVGLDAELIVEIAKTTFSDSNLNTVLNIRIPSVFAKTGDLPQELLSDESITHWRHCRLSGGKRGVLFAATHDELQRNDKSVEKITRIETDGLRDLYSYWITRAGLGNQHIDEKKLRHLVACLQAVNESHVARTIEIFADFVIAIAEGVIKQGLPVQRAVDNALPALRLPRNAGYFDRIPEKLRGNRSEWLKIFRRLHSRIRPLLVRENERGDSITDQLRKNFSDIQDRLSDDQKTIIESFLNADLSPDSWSQEQIGLAILDWRSITELFDGAERTKALPLGPKTIQFFSDEFDEHLEEDDRDLLEGALPKSPTDQLEDFFEQRREQLSRDKKLYGQWERYIYRNPQPFDDFFVGLIDTLHRLRDRTDDSDLKTRKLVVRIPNGREKSFWRGKNVHVVRYFAFRYRGIANLFGDDVEIDFGRLNDFYFPEPDDALKNTSASRDARQLKFEVELDPHGAKSKLMFIWEMPADALAGAMASDLLRVANLNGVASLLPTAEIARQSVSAKGQIQRIALDDINTIRDVDNGNNGCLVAPNRPLGDRTDAFYAELESLRGTGLDDVQSKEIATTFSSFSTDYTKAIRDWVGSDGEGIAGSSLATQAETFGRLLRVLSSNANNDLARQRLWREILGIGVANVGGGASAAIITPWHPLRVAEIHVKAVQAAKLIVAVLNADEEDIFRADILFNQKRQELKANFYPEICVGFEDDKPILLSAAETLFDYTLAEPPRRRLMQNGEDALDIEPGVAAKAFSSVGEQYLNLLPHERTNFSVVLYNAESKALPSAIASELSSKVEQENELQCDLLLTHSQPMRMRRIYEQQNVAVSEEAGSVMASEASRNFLSRLRVGFLDVGHIPDDDTARPADLVLLQDVIARNADIQWKSAPGTRHPELISHVPSQWSRRRPVGAADRASAVYLASPVQPNAGQAYLNAVHIFLEGDNARPGDVVPAREINFRDGEVASVFRQTHRIGEWVVNFDELVDRRLLSNNGVNVIRHIHDRNVDRNIVVSTTSRPRLLHTLIRERIDRIDPAILQTSGDNGVERLIDHANALSGQVVMRAARYGQFANELLGVVLSMQRLRAGLGDLDLPIGWYFLDDFASWFGQREEQIADIMAIAPRVENGNPVLKLAISEAKFVSSEGYRAHANKSSRQLLDTVARISRALDPKHKRIDRETWLNRLGDFMIEGMDPFDGVPIKGWDLHRWSDEVRQDNIPIKIVGFSHVFVHDDDAYVDSGDPTPLSGMEHCVQEIFDKSRVAAELRSFCTGTPLLDTQIARESEGWDAALVSRTSIGLKDIADLEADVSKQESVSSELVQEHKTAHAEEKTSPEKHSAEMVPEVECPTLDAGPVVKSIDANVSPAEETLVHAQSQWPSASLRDWVSKGRIAGEEDAFSLEWLDDIVTRLQRSLRGYDMTAELLGSRLTPNAALVRLRGSDDLTTTKIERRRQELLTSHAIDVINVLAAPGEIIVMIRRPERAVLRLRDLWRRRELPDTAPESNSSLLIGARESDGEMLYLNVGDAFAGYQPHGPHTLIAGETGSGKGVLVQCLLLDICATNSPKSAHIYMVDPKAGIDFPWLRKMPHLVGDLVTTQDEAVVVFEELVAEMERRNRLLAEAGVTKLALYNKKADPEARLPRIWLFHDELADWMLIDEYRDAVETNVTRLGVKARAAGINLVLITQRPDKDALPMQLRANLSNRLVLKVADKRNSELVLDEPGAERLLGRGHLAAKLSGEGKIILAQVPFASDEEIFELAQLISDSYS